MQDPVFEIFREEAKEHLTALEKGFLDLENAAAPEVRRERIDSLFRHAHSLKGDARAIGLAALQEASQLLEDILDAVRDSPETVSGEVINQGLAQLDSIRQLFEAWQRSMGDDRTPAESPTPAVDPSREPTTDPIDSAAASAAPEREAANAGALALAPPALPEESFTVRVPTERLDRMLNLAGELRIVQRSGDESNQRLAELNQVLGQLLERCQRLEQVVHQGSESADLGSEVQAEFVHFRPWLESCRDQVVRVEKSLRKKRSREEILLETLDADIQQARLLPLVMLTDSLRRVVRDLAQSLDKPIRYDVDVGSVLLDKAVLEALRDPMLHLLRNAASHGLESNEERQSAGKPQEGVIRVQASRQGNGVRILVSDDGRGVDYDRIRTRVRQTEGLSDAEVSALTREELARYLFKAGFTTATFRDSISGRGVGLDVVQHSAQRLHGSVQLESSTPQGTTFAITVPISLSTIRVLTVLEGGQRFGISSSQVEKTGRVRCSELRELEGCPVLTVDGELVSWYPLKAILRMTAQPRLTNQTHVSYLLVRREGRPIAVAVDDMEEEVEVLLKPLGFPLSDISGIIGAAVRPDGSVQLVLDLVHVSLKSTAGALTRPPEIQPSGRILLVDDSPTTRTILRNVFTAAGYVIRTAFDGVDALERLRAEAVDLVVSDVEMPRMDGFELTRQVKAKYRLPVILVTGLEKEEARRKGLEAGADAYVVKSTFQGEGLLDIIKQFV